VVIALTAAAATWNPAAVVGADCRGFIMAPTSGLFDATANACYLLATKTGLLDVF
jgi:hypothetical protein